MGFYNNIDELGFKIEKLLTNPKKIDQYGKNGKKRYFELFNNIKITNDIINKTF